MTLLLLKPYEIYECRGKNHRYDGYSKCFVIA